MGNVYPDKSIQVMSVLIVTLTVVSVSQNIITKSITKQIRILLDMVRRNELANV